jgi:hypothetical protein
MSVILSAAKNRRILSLLFVFASLYKPLNQQSPIIKDE